MGLVWVPFLPCVYASIKLIVPKQSTDMEAEGDQS